MIIFFIFLTLVLNLVILQPFNEMSSIIHTKEAILTQLDLPFELVDIIKSFVFYDIKTANAIKQTKRYKMRVITAINESTENNYVVEQERDAIIEMDAENMLFQPSGIWLFGYINHPIETIQMGQIRFCLTCGNYISDIYHRKIICNCVNHYMELPEFFAN